MNHLFTLMRNSLRKRNEVLWHSSKFFVRYFFLIQHSFHVFLHSFCFSYCFFHYIKEFVIFFLQINDNNSSKYFDFCFFFIPFDLHTWFAILSCVELIDEILINNYHKLLIKYYIILFHSCRWKKNFFLIKFPKLSLIKWLTQI